jgi:long-chain acyl-CoA synthetase
MPATPSSRIDTPTLAAMFREAVRRHGDRPAFAPRPAKGDRHEPVTYLDLYERALCLATGLLDLGITSGSRVALLSDNRIEWILCDCALLTLGAADVPRGSDITDSEIQHILSHSDSVAVFVETRALIERVVRLQPAYPGLRWIIAMDEAVASPPGHPHLYELTKRGRELRADGDRRAEEAVDSVTADSIATIIYTSGTTGVPKGVVLTHGNLASQVRNLPVALRNDDRMLSILPIWHAYERVVEYVAIAMGACTYYTNVRNVGEDLKTVRPTFMASAPRLWESLHQKILSGVRSAPAPRRALFHSAVAVARWCRGSAAFLRGNEIDLEGRSQPVTLLLGFGHALRWLLTILPCLLLDALVLRKVRAALGGSLRATISGGGALPRAIDEFMNYCGIPVLEGYGLTETSPVLAVRHEKRIVIGTVGPPYPQTEIRIVDLSSQEVLYPNPSKPRNGLGQRGEIQARGPQVMQGYHKQPEATAGVFQDGWFRTGDIGIMTHNGCLRIAGRIKETIVLLSGENVEPGPIEARLTESPLIHQAVVLGQDAKSLSALIVPSLDGCRHAGLQAESLEKLVVHPALKTRIDAEISRLVNHSRDFKPFEKIQDWRAIPKPFEVGDELTATYKLRRHVIVEKYAKV